MSEEASRWKKFLTRQGIVFHQKLLCSEVFDNVKEYLSQEIMVLEKILVWPKSSGEYLLHNEKTLFKTLLKANVAKPILQIYDSCRLKCLKLFLLSH